MSDSSENPSVSMLLNNLGSNVTLASYSAVFAPKGCRRLASGAAHWYLHKYGLFFCSLPRSGKMSLGRFFKACIRVMPKKGRRVATVEQGAQSIQPSLRDADKLATIAQSLKELPKLKRRYAATKMCRYQWVEPLEKTRQAKFAL